MKILPLFLILFALIAFVSGQLLFKHAMETSHKGFDRNFAKFFVPAIGCMTVSFFLTLGLLQRFDLSYIYPFQGLSVIFVTLMGGIILKERLTARLLVGTVIVGVGVILVSIS